jgi:CHAT domain-containing protein
VPPTARVPRFVPLGPAAPIDAAVLAMRAELLTEARAGGRGGRRTEASYRAAGAKLRRLVWDPLGTDLSTARRVFIVPDGALHLVSFAALPTGTSTYLVDSTPTIHYLSAERDLLSAPSTSSARGLLAVGNPRFDAAAGSTAADAASAAALRGVVALPIGGPCGAGSLARFESLPGALAEAQAVSGLWRKYSRDARTLGGAAATQAAVKELAPGRRVIHFATHAFFLRPDCANASNDFSPMFLSGLALAGANRRGANAAGGVITAAEVATLPLAGLEWAVLSACDTGLGSIAAGEGVFGLQRAFRIAGAATVIMSLWPVDDEATRAWMVPLYTARLERRLSTADAVRLAMRSVLAARRQAGQSAHPFYWAGFVATGSWR